MKKIEAGHYTSGNYTAIRKDGIWTLSHEGRFMGRAKKLAQIRNLIILYTDMSIAE